MKVFRIVFKTALCLALILIIAVPIVLVIYGIQSTPWVTHDPKLLPEDVARIEALLKRHDPRKLRSGDVRTVTVSERDLNLALRYGLSYLPQLRTLRAHVRLLPNLMQTQFTYRLPRTVLGSYVNVGMDMMPVAPHAWTVRTLRLGDLAIPGWLVRPVLNRLDPYLRRYERYRVFSDSQQFLRSVEMQKQQLAMVYQWSQAHARKVQAQGQALLFSAAEQERLRAYNAKLADLAATSPKQTSLAQFLPPLFQLAQERSARGDARAENRALFQLLAMYAARQPLARLLKAQQKATIPRPRHVKLTLRQRHDLAQHFLISAGITVTTDAGTADPIGLFKELKDAQGGSGFSFADLTADRAGVTIADMAVTAEKAARLQQRLAGTLREDDFMPAVEHLPEGMQQAEFQRRFQDTDSLVYQQMLEEIEQRIAACPLYQL